MISKKLEVIIERLWTLNLKELERLSNEIEAEIIFRDDKRFEFDCYKSEEDNVWDYIMDSYNSNSLIFSGCNFWLIMKICYNCEYPMEEQEFNNSNNPEEPEIWYYCEVCDRHDDPDTQEDEILSKWNGDVIWA